MAVKGLHLLSLLRVNYVDVGELPWHHLGIKVLRGDFFVITIVYVKQVIEISED